MPKAPPSFKKPDALELFTDRVSEQDVLRRVLAPSLGTSDQTVRLLTSFYGVGGVGKTTLCHQALANASREHPGSPIRVHTSFDDHRWTPASGFASVALELCQILSKVNIATELTAALLLLWEKTAGEAGRIEEKWQLAVDAIDNVASAAQLPGVSLLLKGYVYLRDKSRQAAVRQRMHEFDLWPSEVHGRVTKLDVERKLPLSLYHDIRGWFSENPDLELRMLLDGFERIQGKDNRQDAQRGLQEFIGYFASPHHKSPNEAGARFRVVIFGREKLRWDEIYADEDWNTYWSQHLLGGLAESDARSFLQKAAEWRRKNGRHDAADRILASQDEILDAADEEPQGARAFYPYSLDLAVDMLDRACGSAVDLGRTPAELQERFLRYLDPREKRALMILAMAEAFDEGVFDWLVERKLVEYPRYSFNTEVVTGRSYLQKIGEEGDEWRFHRKMEEALQKSWLVTPAAREEGRQVLRDLLAHHREYITAKTPRDWGPRELRAWNRGMEIIVTQGPELGLVDANAWNSLLAEEPWSIEHYLLLSDRSDFVSRIARICESRFGAQHEISCRFLYDEAVHLRESGRDAEAEARHRRILDVRTALLGPGHRDTLVSLNTVARLLDDSGHFAEAEPLCRKAVADCTESLGPTDPETLQAHHNLGSLLNSLGYSAEAEAEYRRALDGRQRTLGPDHPDTLKTMNNLGNVLTERNQLHAAVLMYRTALAAKETQLGVDHPSTLITVGNLADVLETRSEYEQAEALFRRVAAGFSRAYGVSHPTAAAGVGRLAWFLNRQGRHAEALDLCDKAIVERTPLIGDDHATTTYLRHQKARILIDMKMGREALPLLEHVLTALTKSLGPTHPETLDALDDLAGVEASRGQLARAEALYQQAASGLTGTRGVYHPETLGCRARLANLLVRAARLGEAESIYRDVLETREKVLGPMHRDTLDAMDDLAGLFARMGRYTAAEDLYRRAAAGLAATLGETHADTLTCRRRLAHMYQSGSGEFGKAEEIIQSVLQAATSSRGPLHPYTLDVLDDLAGLHAARGDYANSEECYVRVISGLLETLGADHSQTLASRLQLARMLQNGPERFDQAEELFGDVLARRERVLGPTHPLTLDSIDDLAAIFEAKGDFIQSQHHYESAANGLTATLGGDHPQTLACRLRLARMLQRGPEQYDEAEGIFRDVLARFQNTLGEMHPRTLDVIDDLGSLFALRGDYGRSQHHYEDAAEGLAVTLGIDHPQTLACRWRLAHMLLHHAGHPDKAEAIFRDVLERQDRALGPTNPHTKRTFESLAALLSETDRQTESLALRRHWYARSEDCAAATRYNLACEECLAGNLDAAMQLILEEMRARPDRKKLALEDESLAAIRDFVSGI